MLKFASLAKAFVFFSTFKLVPIFFVLNTNVRLNSFSEKILLAPLQEISIDGGGSAYALVEDNLFFTENTLIQNKKNKNFLYLLNAHKKLVHTNKNNKKHAYKLVSGNVFNWLPWYKEINQNGGGLVVDQKDSKLLIATNIPKKNIIKKTSNTKYFTKSRGRFFLKDGLFINQSKIFIYQVLKGLKVSDADINYKKAEFSFKKLFSGGSIVAELKNNFGQLIGFGQLSNKIESSPILNIHDLSLGLKAKVLSSKVLWAKNFLDKNKNSSSNIYIESLNQKTLYVNGLHKDKNLNTDSNYLLSAYDKKYWPSLSFGSAFSLNNLYLFSKSVINSIYYLIYENFLDYKKTSIVWGRISYKGRPVSGARVFLYGSNITPIYFDNWLPDKSLKQTSASGLFVFMGLKDGINSLKAKFLNHAYNLKFVPSQSGKVSFVDLIESKKTSKQINVYDSISKKFLKSKISLFGENFQFLIDQKNSIKLNQQSFGENLQIFEVQAQNAEYQNLSFISFSNKNKVSIPMFKKSWINLLGKNIPYQSGTSILIGLRKKSIDFSLTIKSLLGGVAYNKNYLLYFNKDFQAYKTPKEDAIGFIAFNLPRGLYSANIVNRDKKRIKTISKLVISEPKSLQILSF